MKIIMAPSSKTISITKTNGHASNHENDFNYAALITRIILQMIGLWPISRFASNVEKIVTRLQNALCYFLFAFTLVGILLMFLKERDFKRKVKILGPFLNCTMSCMKYSMLVYHAREIQICLDQIRRDWKDTIDRNDRRAMLSKARVGRKFAIFSAVFMYIGGLSYRTVVPLSKGRILTPMNITVRALACPSYFVIFDEQATPAYEIVFALQFFAGLVIYSVTCGAAGLAALFIMHVCGQLSIVIGMLQRLNNMPIPEDRAVAISLADIVEHQIKVKSFLKQVEDAMRYIWLTEIMGSTMVICLTGYYIIMEWESSNSTAMLTYSVILTSFTISIFINCYVGQLLTDQSIEVELTTSTMNWYRLPQKKARTLILIMAITNIPAKITAGKMIEMSLPTFSDIIKTSVAYFNLLRKFSK